MATALPPVAVHLHDGGVSPTPTRRRFTRSYKQRILTEAARCSKPGELGALLRCEGLYSSHLAAWRAAERRGDFVTSAPARRRGPAPTPVDPRVKRVAELERQLAKATARAERAEALIAFNPMRDLQAPRPSAPRCRWLDVPDMIRLAGEQREPYQTLSALLGGTGIEVSVAIRLRARDVDLERREIRAARTKTHARDRIVGCMTSGTATPSARLVRARRRR